MLLKKIFVGCLFLLSGCGFSPLYMVDKNTGQLETEKIEVAPIQDYNGYVLKQGLDNAFNPKKVHGPKKYILKVQMKNPHLSSQSIQGDNFASRKKVSLRASFQLIDKETKKYRDTRLNSMTAPVPFLTTVKTGLLLFLPSDALKIFAACILCPKVRRALEKS